MALTIPSHMPAIKLLAWVTPMTCWALVTSFSIFLLARYHSWTASRSCCRWSGGSLVFIRMLFLLNRRVRGGFAEAAEKSFSSALSARSLRPLRFGLYHHRVHT